MEEPQPQPETCEAGYRVKKISIRRGYVIDQIKFQYDDHKIWSVGVDGGRKDNRDLIMTPGEYLVRVTHETLRQRSVSSLNFHPGAVCYLSSGGTPGPQWSSRPTRGELSVSSLSWLAPGLGTSPH